MSTSVTIQIFAGFEVFEDGTVVLTVDPGETDIDFFVDPPEDDFVWTPELEHAIQTIQTAARRWTGSPIKVTM